jgi:hypothetical protein
MGIDGPQIHVEDDAIRQRRTDLPEEQPPDETSRPLLMRLASALERVEAAWQARRAVDKAYAEQIGDQISKGHAFGKHVIKRGEFPGVTTPEQFALVIKDAVMNGEFRPLSGGRTAYWSDGTVVIRNPSTADGGTALRPTRGYDYFMGLH